VKIIPILYYTDIIICSEIIWTLDFEVRPSAVDASQYVFQGKFMIP
jgi:hypothetical protein